MSYFGIKLVYLQNVSRKTQTMITKELIAPKSIVVVGGSDDVHKPGGATLKIF